jgi:hypothetical protein
LCAPASSTPKEPKYDVEIVTACNDLGMSHAKKYHQVKSIHRLTIKQRLTSEHQLDLWGEATISVGHQVDLQLQKEKNGADAKRTEPSTRPQAKGVIAVLLETIPLVEWRYSPIERPPGMRLHRFASFFFPRQIYETRLKNDLADMQHEYFEALQAGDVRKARWVHIRGTICFCWNAVWAVIPESLISLVRSVFKFRT